MAASATIQSVNKLQNAFFVVGKVTLSGNYVADGDVLNLAASGIPVSTGTVPLFVSIVDFPATDAAATGYVFRFAIGSSLANGKVQVFESAGSAAPLSELSAGAYPAGLTSAVIKFQALIPAL